MAGGKRLNGKWRLSDQAVGHGDDVYVHVDRPRPRRAIQTYAYSKTDGARPDEDFSKITISETEAVAAATESNVSAEFTKNSVRVEVRGPHVDFVFCRGVVCFAKVISGDVLKVPFIVDPALCSFKVVPGKKIVLIIRPTLDGDGPQRPRLECLPEFGGEGACGKTVDKDEKETKTHASASEMNRYLCGPDMSYDFRCFRCNAPLKKVKGEIVWEARRCGGCGKAYYCDRICQRIHWQNGHREECAALAADTSQELKPGEKHYTARDSPAQISDGLMKNLLGF